MKLLESLIREVLLSEQVFGAQAFVYHGSLSSPDKFSSLLLNNEFAPGAGAGSLYGKGLYTVYDLKRGRTEGGYYGDFLYKLKVNLYGCIIFDKDTATKVYGKPIPPSEQAAILGKDELSETLKLDGYDKRYAKVGSEGITSGIALDASEFLEGKVKGIVYTGEQDGRCVLIYDPSIVVPVSWKSKDDESWNSFDRTSLKPALSRAASDVWEEDRYDTQKQLERARRMPPDKRTFAGNLIIRNPRQLAEIPENLVVTGNFECWRESGIKSLPKGLKIMRGGLDAGHTDITSLPDDMKHLKFLSLKKTAITSLPSGMVIDEDLNLSESKIRSLPEDISVGKDLFLAGTQISRLPEGISLSGNLDLGFTPIRNLPENLTVGGQLNLGGCKNITSLPRGLKVGGTLVIASTNIREIPADAVIGMLYAYDSPMQGKEGAFNKR